MKKILLLLVVLSSCAPIYVPNIRNSPMFTKGGEFQAAMQVGNGYDVQTAMSITNNIGLMANYAYINRDRFDPDNQDDYHRHRLFEGGLGYFKNEETMFLEVFVGYGKGEGSSYDQFSFFGPQSIQATGKYERYFIQPAFGMNKKMMHVSFVPRISIVDFTEFSNGATSVPIDETPEVFFEPAVIGRANGMNNHIFYTFQAGFSVAVNSDLYFDHRQFQFSTGIGFRFGGVKEEAPAKKYRE